MRAASSWDSRSSTTARLKSFHQQLQRIAWSNYERPSSHTQTLPRLANPTVQKILTNLAKVQYNASRSAHRVPLQQLGNITSALISAGYLCELFKDSRKVQKYYASLKQKVTAKAQEIFQVQNLKENFELTQFYPTKVELHSQQAFGKNNLAKKCTLLYLS